MAKAKKRPIAKPKRRAKPSHIGRQAARTPPTALVIRRPATEVLKFSDEEVVLLKNTFARGATDEELKFCLATALRYRLDPFKKQIWFVPRWDSEALRSDGKKGRTVFTPQVSIDGLQHIAARDHKDYGSADEPEWGEAMTVRYQVRGAGPTLDLAVPSLARAAVWKKGAARPTVGTVRWAEIYPDIDYAPLVRRMPYLMLAKCARAQAIRIAYPSTGGLLIPEECQSREYLDITPEGRILQRAETSEEAYNRREAENIAALPAEEQEKIRARQSASAMTPIGDVALKLPADAQKPTSVIDIQVKPQEPTMPYVDGSKFGAITWTYDAGRDLANLGGDKAAREAAWPILKKYWVNAPQRRYVINGEQLENLKALLPMAGFKFEREKRDAEE